MIAKKCDRCGVFYENYKEVLNGDGVNSMCFTYCNNIGGVWTAEKHYDLCPSCLRQLKEFLNNLSEAKPDEKKP